MNNLKHRIKWNHYYNCIWKSVSWGYDIPDQHVRDFMDYYWFNKGDNAIDVGCGFWKNSKIFSQKKVNYTWIDISKLAIKDATKKYESWTFICSDFLTYDFKNKKYNYLIDAWCIHVNDPKDTIKFLDKYFDLLEKWWKLFIRIFKWDLGSNKPLFLIDDFLPVWWYSQEQFSKLIDKSRFNLDKVILDKNYYEEDEIYYFYITKI